MSEETDIAKRVLEMMQQLAQSIRVLITNQEQLATEQKKAARALGATGIMLARQGLAVAELNQSTWKIGRRNPAYGRSYLERHIFHGAFEAVDRMLGSWKHEDEGFVDAYTIKELRISERELTRVASALQTLSRVHEIVEVSVIKYLHIPLQFRQSIEQIVAVEVLSPGSC